eukprot:scaffold7625_cov277-Pinguiococcus_pyrenoidosus.AAC.7
MDHMSGQCDVVLYVDAIQQEEQQVESTQQRVWQVHVLADRALLVVAAVERIGGSEDCCAGVQPRGDPGFRDAHRLLLHHFVDRRPILVVHLVELVNAADALVRQHERPALERHLSADLIPGHGCREPHPAAALAGGVNGPGSDDGDVLEELRLGNPGIPHEADVDVAPNRHAVPQRSMYAPGEHEEQGLLHVLIAPDCRRDAPGKPRIRVGRVRKLVDGVLDALVDVHQLVVVLLVPVGVLHLDEGVGDQASPQGLVAAPAHGHEDAADRHEIARLQAADHLSPKMRRDRARHVAHGHLIGQLLQLGLLERNELGSAGLQLQPALCLVLLAVRGVAEHQWQKVFPADLLIDFVPAGIARVRAYAHERSHRRDSRDHRLDRHQGADVRCAHLPNGNRFAAGLGPKEEVKAPHERCRRLRKLRRIVGIVHILVTAVLPDQTSLIPPLLHQHIQDVRLLLLHGRLW